jgi:hypothetical protein
VAAAAAAVAGKKDGKTVTRRASYHLGNRMMPGTSLEDAARQAVAALKSGTSRTRKTSGGSLLEDDIAAQSSGMSQTDISMIRRFSNTNPAIELNDSEAVDADLQVDTGRSGGDDEQDVFADLVAAEEEEAVAEIVNQSADADADADADVDAQLATGTDGRKKQVLTREQRQHLRASLFTVIASLIRHSPCEREVRPLLQYLAVARDTTVINELSQLILCLVIDGGPRILSAITEACHGAEEFASLVLHRLIQLPLEEARCLGIRLLTHYYIRLGTMSSSMLVLTLRRKKMNFLHRAMEKIAYSGDAGLRRFQVFTYAHTQIHFRHIQIQDSLSTHNHESS